MAGLYNGECLPWECFVVSDYHEEHSEYCTSLQGCSQDFSKGGSQQGHHPGIADYIRFIPLLSLVYQRAQLY